MGTNFYCYYLRFSYFLRMLGSGKSYNFLNYRHELLME